MNKARALALIVCVVAVLVLSLNSDVIGSRFGIWGVIGGAVLYWTAICFALVILVQVIERTFAQRKDRVP